MQKPLIIVVLAVIGAAALWTYLGSNEQTEDVVSTVPPSSPTSDQTTATLAADSESPAVAAELDTASDNEAESPFAVVAEPETQASADTDTAPQPSTTADNANVAEPAVAASADTNTNLEARNETEFLPGIVVPSSYPASEAAKYFVPADQRRPGNLGGPPPLPFAEGNTGPSLPDGGLTPPPAPEQ
ncbi:MAG: hypothetical protein AB8B97_00850 [Granulosicoccus sp.]